MARIVVTGAAGFLGSHICEALLARGDDVVAIDNLITGNEDNLSGVFGNQRFEFLHHDVSTYISVPGHVDAVMHFASPASPKDYLDLPIQTLKVGSLGTHNCLGLAKAKGARFFLASTSEVYGDPEVHPQTEDYWGHVNPIGPRGVYDEAKRFAEAMTMAYHRFHGLDVRIVRIFNSILADEQVLYDDGVELRREPVEELAKRLGGAIDLWGYSVPAFGADGSITSSETTGLVGHRPSGKCFEVRTRYGRSIRVTADHSVFVEASDGSPVAKPVSQLAVGESIAIAGRVDVPERDRIVVRMTEVWDRTGLSPWDLLVRGHGLGEEAWTRRHEAFEIIRKERCPTNRSWRNSIWGEIRRMREREQMPLALLRRLGVKIPGDAVVRLRTAGATAELPETVILDDELLWFLGLYVAEGCRFEKLPKSAMVTLGCDDDTLDRAQKVIERELNLRVGRVAATPARCASLYVHSRLLLHLLDHLGFGAGPKRIPGWVLGLPTRRLKWFVEGYREGDGVHSGEKLDGTRHEFSTTSDALKDDLIVAFGRFGLVPSVGRYLTRNTRRPNDPDRPFWRLTLAHVSPWSPLSWDRGVEQRLNARRYGDLVWAKVTSIEEIEPTARVYDFCVPGKENFWAGTGVMAKNTYGPRMRPNDGRVVSNFLVQALQGKPLTVYGDGTQTRSFCYVEDEVRGFLALLDSDHVGPVNIGNPNEFTMLELADAVKQVTGSTSEIVFEPLPVDDPTQRQPDITLAKTLLGWEPDIQLHAGLARTAEWMRTVI